jgi:hypothetical protein
LPEEELRHRLTAARIVVCHSGMGILGEAMRARRPILAVPRTGPTTPDNPANDQRGFLQRLLAVHPIEVCPEPANLMEHLRRLATAAPDWVDYRLDCDIPRIVAGFLSARRPSSMGAAERRP